MALLNLFNFLHFVGLIWGVGGATIATIISVKADKNPDVAKASMKIMPAIVKLIWLGMILLIISGIALPFYISWPLNKQMLLVKHVLVAWIVIFGVAVGMSSKKMSRFAPKGKEAPDKRFIKAKKRTKAFSIVNLILWYVVTLLSVWV